MDLAFFRRGRLWAPLFGLLLFGNGFLHLCCHEHLLPNSDAAAYGHCSAAVRVSDCLRHSVALTEGVYCPCCSAAFDWFADTAAAGNDPVRGKSVEPFCAPRFHGFAASADRRSRAPPLA